MEPGFPLLISLPDRLLSVIYPQQCIVCKSIVERHEDGVACGECWVATRVFDGNEVLCFKCGAFLRESPTAEESDCKRCFDDVYDKAKAIGLYEKALKASILHLKKTPHVSKRLRKLLFAAFDNSGFSPSLIVPVPLSKKRQIERGYNQAEILAALLSKFSGIPYDCRSLYRKSHSSMHRTGMDRKARELSVKNAFEVIRPKLIKDAQVLLVDDIFTSGSTASHCAKALKKAGAVSVDVLSIARA
ncbi:MAG: double zinc ribbon domain-containing protein [Blastocatellia bacterium]